MIDREPNGSEETHQIGDIAGVTGQSGTAVGRDRSSIVAATGLFGRAISSANVGIAAATEEQSTAVVTGSGSIAVNTGLGAGALALGKACVAVGTIVRGRNGNALFALERAEDKILSTAAGIVGERGLEENTWYKCQDGKFVETHWPSL